ncbi:hypothetical protein G9A89_004886 [Geosiphon pyriformis]|nr:hypothetical protein G9A89_004886 [Geosiphon pyriformis]
MTFYNEPSLFDYYDPLYDLDFDIPWFWGGDFGGRTSFDDRNTGDDRRDTQGGNARGGRGGSRPIQDRIPRHAVSKVMTEREGDTVWRPATDVLTTDDAFIIHVDLPGVPKEDIKIDLRNRELVISGESKGDEAYNAATSRVRERKIGKFRKHVFLPRNMKLDKENIKAGYNNGLLEVKIPRADGEPAARINIQ